MTEPSAAGFELSPQQKHLWRLGAGDFSTVIAVLVEGKVSSQRLKNALLAAIGRHEILRTTFPRRPGMKLPVQFVNQELAPSWQEIDLRSLPLAQQNARLHELFQEEKRQDFALNRGPVVRATLLELGEEKHVLELGVPSLCADARTLRNLVEEISAFYGSEAKGQEEILQYADLSAWQNQLLEKEDEDTKAGKDYWHQFDFDSSAALRLPFELRPDEIWRFSPESVMVEVRPDITAAIDGDAAVFLAACWQLLQWRLTGQTKIVIGHVCQGRNHEELTRALGLFNKSLPVAHDFENDCSFLSVMKDIRTTLTNADTWQDYLPVDESSQDPPISFMAEERMAKYCSAGVEYSLLRQESTSQRFHLQLCCTLAEGNSTAELRYDPQFFARATVERVARHFATLVTSATQNPQTSISSLAMMSESDQQQVVITFNQTRADYPQTKCIHQLWEEQVEKTPARPALRFGTTCLTYRELNARSNQLAHLLRGHGVRADIPVGLLVDRSAEMIIGVLGILKAGGAYVPLAPDTPQARLAHQLSETNSPILLSEQKFLGNLPEFSGQIICFDRDRELLLRESVENPEVINTSENLVYVIYTSGSTGVPKGVAVRHSSLVNYAHFIAQKLKAHAEAMNFATVSILAADLGNTSIFPSLISGGCLHVIGYETAMSRDLFLDYVNDYPIDVLKITPSHLNMLLSSPEDGALLPRKYLILGGEPASWELVRRVVDWGKCAVINHYGPTEATVGCSTFSVADSDVSAWTPATVPIGRPIANDRIYILDQRLKPVPVGVSGELCIGGAGIAKGYLNQPEHSSQRFVADPFSPDPEAQLYRTGDLARFLPDGNVEFLGRIDRQIKIRGFRVEPAEIENVLKQNSAVDEVAVVSGQDKSGNPRLVAYVVSAQDPHRSTEELRNYLRERLPEYMVPSSIVKLDRLPLTANGKLDLRALPSPDEVPATSARTFCPPRNRLEQGLADIWREVLGINQVGVEDNFFDLGGHSLLATQVISRVRSTFGIPLPLRSVFESPTVAALAGQIAELQPQVSDDKEMANLLRELEGLSEEEANRLLANEIEKGADNSG